MPAFYYLPLKVPIRHDLFDPLAQWLDDDEQQVGFDSRRNTFHNHSHDDDDALPEMFLPKPPFSSSQCRLELKRLAGLRNSLSESLMESHSSALEQNALQDLQDYHATLLEFEKRGFPTRDDDRNGIALTWKGAFSKTQQETHNTFVWDRVCVLWNVAALASCQASTLLLHESSAATTTTSSESCKVAISNFQQAASWLQLAQQLVQSSSSSSDIETIDLSSSMLQFWQGLLLAQAQTCIYKLANNLGTRQHSTLAYLMQGAARLYNEACQLAQEPRLQSEVPTPSTEWATHAKAQSLVCQARSRFHKSLDERQQQQHGLEIAWLQDCVEHIKECQAFLQSANLPAWPEVEGLLRLARDRLSKAEADNHNVYMEQVPSRGDLPEIRSQVLVKRDVPLPASMLVSRVPLFESIS